MFQRENDGNIVDGPIVTVIMAVYRESDQIVRCALQSVLDQTYPVFEIIIVNDSGFPRKDLSNISQIHQSVRVIDHAENRGGAAAYNTGIDAARGDLIAFIDADDLWYPEKLKTQLDVAVDHGAYFFASNCMLVWNGERRLCNQVPPDPYTSFSKYLLRGVGALQSSTLIVPTAIAKQVRYRSGLRRHVDWDFVLRLQQAGIPLVYNHQALSDYILSDNPDRVSLQKNGYLATVEWFKLSKDYVPAVDRQYYFFRHCTTRETLRTPLSLTLATMEVIAQNPVNGLKEAIGAVWRGLVRGWQRMFADRAAL